MKISLVGLAATMGLASGAIAPQTAKASDEFRAGIGFQIPFSTGGNNSGINWKDTRIMGKAQYANVEDTEVSIDRNITNSYSNGNLIGTNYTDTITKTDEGNKVYGLEAGLGIDFHGNVSTELLGFYGTNDVQGAAGVGYDFESGLFLDVKLMAPFAEAGMRFDGENQVYMGANTLGSFSPEVKNGFTEYVNDVFTFTGPSGSSTPGNDGSTGNEDPITIGDGDSDGDAGDVTIPDSGTGGTGF